MFCPPQQLPGGGAKRGGGHLPPSQGCWCCRTHYQHGRLQLKQCSTTLCIDSRHHIIAFPDLVGSLFLQGKENLHKCTLPSMLLNMQAREAKAPRSLDSNAMKYCLPSLQCHDIQLLCKPSSRNHSGLGCKLCHGKLWSDTLGGGTLG